LETVFSFAAPALDLKSRGSLALICLRFPKLSARQGRAGLRHRTAILLIAAARQTTFVLTTTVVDMTTNPQPVEGMVPAPGAGPLRIARGAHPSRKSQNNLRSILFSDQHVRAGTLEEWCSLMATRAMQPGKSVVICS
jgi:hypothetical protein